MTQKNTRVTEVMDRPMRKIRSFARRSGRITESQKKSLAELWPLHGIDYRNAKLDFANIFSQEANTHIEIGFGMAENLIAVALDRPDDNFIGIEVHQPAVGHALTQINLHELKNLKIINHDAVEVLTNQISDNSIDSMSIFFPDPWHKSKHHKRRLISPRFVHLLADKLQQNGHIYLATDWQHYAEQMLEVFSEDRHFRNLSPNGDYCKRMAFRPITKFERRGQRLGHGVWDLIFEKK